MPAGISEGVVHGTTGSLTGAGAAINVNLGFTPSNIKVINLTDVIIWEWMVGMPANDTIKQVTGGTTTLDTTGAIVPLASVTQTGFTLSAALAANGKSLIYKAS